MTLQTTIDMLLVATILLDLGILAVSRLVTSVRFFALQSLLLAFLPLLGELSHGEGLSLHAPLVAAVTIALKVTLIPYILIRIVRTGEIHAEITPLLGFTASVFVGAVLVAASFAVATRLTMPSPLWPMSSMVVPAALSTLAIGLLVLVTRVKAITQVLGFLLVENGIFTFGLTLLKSMPVLVELGILLDVFVGVFIMAIVVYHIRREFDHMDTDALAEVESH
jgi:hydrogenase-4 component E